MRRSWPMFVALGLSLPLLGVFATGCHEREVTYYRAYPRREVYVEPGYEYHPYRHEREEREEREYVVPREREHEHGYHHEREHREDHD